MSTPAPRLRIVDGEGRHEAGELDCYTTSPRRAAEAAWQARGLDWTQVTVAAGHRNATARHAQHEACTVIQGPISRVTYVFHRPSGRLFATERNGSRLFALRLDQVIAREREWLSPVARTLGLPTTPVAGAMIPTRRDGLPACQEAVVDLDEKEENVMPPAPTPARTAPQPARLRVKESTKVLRLVTTVREVELSAWNLTEALRALGVEVPDKAVVDLVRDGKILPAPITLRWAEEREELVEE